MRNYALELEKRAAWVKDILLSSGAKGIIYGNSGGKDCTLVSAICRHATENVLGVIMPCHSTQNYGADMTDAYAAAEKYGIKNIVVDISDTKNALVSALDGQTLSSPALSNIQPRLRMTTLYALGQSLGYLVAGTGNRCEYHLGYFTKWGDGAYDLNPISDLTVTEVYEFLRYLDAPENIIKKPPSAGLYEGQTDEGDMGITYSAVDEYLLTGKTDEKSTEIIEKYHSRTQHKRMEAYRYED